MVVEGILMVPVEVWFWKCLYCPQQQYLNLQILCYCYYYFSFGLEMKVISEEMTCWTNVDDSWTWVMGDVQVNPNLVVVMLMVPKHVSLRDGY